MAALPIREDDDARTKAAEHRGDLEAIGQSVLDVAVGQIEGFAVGDVEDAGGCVRFGFPVGSGAAGAGLTLGQVEDASVPAAGMHGKERATAGLFNVVAVSGDGEDVD